MTETGSRAVTKLTSIASEALGSHPNDEYDFLDIYPLSSELLSMLHEKNGFYAFESALHVFPISSRDCMSLQEWNSDSLWRNGYRDLAAGLLFFAEDVFQDQFCLSTSGVVRFDAETGRIEPYAESIEGWARRVLSHYHVDTGWTLATKWQQEKGSLRPGYRLMPKTPFFLGGQYSLDNLLGGGGRRGDEIQGQPGNPNARYSRRAAGAACPSETSDKALSCVQNRWPLTIQDLTNSDNY